MADPPGTSLTLSTEHPPARAGHYGPFARWLLSRMFRSISFPDEAREALRSVSLRGTPVYVLRSSSLLHLLFFNWSFWRLGVPIARAATGLGYRIFAPFARWYLGGAQVRPPPSAQDRSAAQVIEAVRQGESAMVFLRMPRTLPSAVSILADPFPGLVSLQRELPGRRVQLVPITLLWRRRPKKLRGGVRDFLFGDRDEPGAIRSRASASATTPIGTLMKKIHDQLRPSVSAPPASGPMATAIPTVEPHTAIAVPRSGPRNSCAMSARPVANIAAPPKPWTARARSSIVGVVARPQTKEASENTVTPTAKTRLRPIRSARLPAVSSAAANVRA